MQKYFDTLAFLPENGQAEEVSAFGLRPVPVKFPGTFHLHSYLSTIYVIDAIVLPSVDQTIETSARVK